MFIDKALKREARFKKVFFAIMVTLGLSLPIITYLSNLDSVFIMGYLAVIELLIIFAVVASINKYKLRYNYSNNRLRYKSGISFRENLILCDKISIVHTNKSEDDLEIIIVSSVKFKNKYCKPISKGFQIKYPEAGNEYLRLKRIYPENEYYFQLIRKGALKKYLLLDLLFTTCVNAVYTASAIDNIKVARKQNEFHKERR